MNDAGHEEDTIQDEPPVPWDWAALEGEALPELPSRVADSIHRREVAGELLSLSLRGFGLVLLELARPGFVPLPRTSPSRSKPR